MRLHPLSLAYWLLFVSWVPVFLKAQNASKELPWILRSDKDGIQVYYRQTADVHELKLVTSMQASLASIAQLFDEVYNYPRWGYRLAEARLVKRVSETEMYYYVLLDFPWPLSDRDLIMHTRLDQDPNTRILTSISTAAPRMEPERSGVVRIRDAHSKWVIVPTGAGKVQVEYYLYSNPGGNLPDWLINLAADVGPRESIKKMRALLREGRYRNVYLAHIRE